MDLLATVFSPNRRESVSAVSRSLTAKAMLMWQLLRTDSHPALAAFNWAMS